MITERGREGYRREEGERGKDGRYRGEVRERETVGEGGTAKTRGSRENGVIIGGDQDKLGNR